MLLPTQYSAVRDEIAKSYYVKIAKIPFDTRALCQISIAYLPTYLLTQICELFVKMEGTTSK